MLDPLAAQVALMLFLMAVGMLSASMLIGDLANVYAAGFWRRRAEDRGPADGPRSYRGPERRRREPAWIDVG